jgi:hypothetical protein
LVRYYDNKGQNWYGFFFNSLRYSWKRIIDKNKFLIKPSNDELGKIITDSRK